MLPHYIVSMFSQFGLFMSSVFLWSCLWSTSCLCSSSSSLHAPPLIVCTRVSLAPPPVLVLVAVYLSCHSLSVQRLSSHIICSELSVIELRGRLLWSFHQVFSSSPQNEAVTGETAWKTNRITPPPQNKHGGVENAHAGTLVSPLLLSGCKGKWRSHLRGITWLHPCRTVVNLKRAVSRPEEAHLVF